MLQIYQIQTHIVLLLQEPTEYHSVSQDIPCKKKKRNIVYKQAGVPFT